MSESPRILPTDDDAERAILACAFLRNDAIDFASTILQPPAFTSRKHGVIFAAMVAMRERGEPIDLVTLSAVLERERQLDAAGGRAYLAELLLAVASATEVRRYVEIVRDRWLQRSLIRLFTDVGDRAYALDAPNEIIEIVTRELFLLVSARGTLPWQSSGRVMSDTTDALDERKKADSALQGWSTGLTSLDSLLGGLKPSELVIVGARPSMGKTALACDFLRAASRDGARVGFVSLEMSATQIGLRLLASEGSLDLRELASARLTGAQWRAVAQAGQRLTDRLAWFDDSSYLTMNQLRLKARQLATASGLDLLIVDYLQLLSTESKRRESRQQEISEISRELKLLAKELNICVVALSQLSRACELREDKRPVLADLRDSGAIEQDADVVLFIYRDDAYQPDSDQRGTAELLVRKNRQGQVGVAAAVFQAPFSRFRNLEIGTVTA